MYMYVCVCVCLSVSVYVYVHEVIKKLTFRNRSTIVLRLHLLQITVAIVLKNESDRSHQ